MKKTGKLCAVLLVLLLCTMAVAACAPSAFVKALASDPPAVESADAGKTDAAPSPEKTDEPAPSETPAASYAPGTLSETGFDSEYLGLSFRIPEGSDFVMSTKEELDAQVDAEMKKQGVDMEEAGDMYTYEMMAVSLEDGANAIVSTERVPLGNITPALYLSTVGKSLEASGYTLGDVETVQLAGRDFAKLSTTMSAGGADTIQDYYSTKQDDRIVSIIVTYASGTEDKIESLLAAFAPYTAG